MSDQTTLSPEDVATIKAQLGALMSRVQGTNTSPAALRQFDREYQALTDKIDRLTAERRNLCKLAKEKDGIDVPRYHIAKKLQKMLAPEARHEFTQTIVYGHQLGLFTDWEKYDQEEANAANGASVAAAEQDRADDDKPKAKRKKKAGGPMTAEGAAALQQAVGAQPVTGGTLEAAKAQGHQAGLDGELRNANPHDQAKDPDRWKAWDEGHNNGTLERLQQTGADAAA